MRTGVSEFETHARARLSDIGPFFSSEGEDRNRIDRNRLVRPLPDCSLPAAETRNTICEGLKRRFGNLNLPPCLPYHPTKSLSVWKELLLRKCSFSTSNKKEMPKYSELVGKPVVSAPRRTSDNLIPCITPQWEMLRTVIEIQIPDGDLTRGTHP